MPDQRNGWIACLGVLFLVAIMMAGAFAASGAQDYQSPMAPEVRVIVPNGGETWYVGLRYDIAWFVSNMTGMQHPTLIQYSVNGVGGNYTTITSVNSRPGFNNFGWNVTNTPTKDAAVKVSVGFNGTNYSDESDSEFEIRSIPNDPVVVLAPNGGEVLNVGQRFQMTWNISSPTIPHNVSISYSIAGPIGPWIPITSVSHQNPIGTYRWNVPNTPTKDAYVNVTDVSNKAWDISDKAFEIAGNPNIPQVKVITPNGGEVLKAGMFYNVTWNLTIPQGQGFPTTISYSIKGLNGTYIPIARVPSNRGMNGFNWVVNDTPTKEAVVKVLIGQGPMIIQDTSDSVFEIVGLPPNATLDHVMIIPKSATIEQTKTLQFFAKAFDKSGKEITAGVKYNWESFGGIGTVDQKGLFTAQNIGNGLVKVTGSYLNDKRNDTASVTVIPQGGTITLDHVMIAPKSATVISGKTLPFSARAFDQYNNEIPPQSVSYAWSVSNNIGTVDQAGLFSAQNAGNGLVTAAGTYGGVTKGDSANVTVIPANGTIELTKVTIAPRSVTVKVGNVQKFNARATDQFGNDIPPQMVKYAWSTTGGIGTVDPNGLFTAQNIGKGSVMVEGSMGSATKSDTASVTVVAQNVTITLTKVVIDPKSATVKVNDKIKFSGKAYDQFDNEMPQGVGYTWSATGNIGDVDATGLFVAKNVGSGNVVVTATQGTVSKSDLAQIDVTKGGGQGKLRVVIEPLDIAISVGNTQQFTAKAYDKDGKEITQGVTFTWSVNGTIGTINSTGLFTAKTEGKGSVVVLAEVGGLSATNSTNVTVQKGGGGGGDGGLSGTNGMIILGAAIALVAGVALTALWFRRRRARKVDDTATAGPPVPKDKKG